MAIARSSSSKELIPHQSLNDTSVTYKRYDLIPLSSDILKQDDLVDERYEVKGKLGKGSHGEVYSAYDKVTKLVVALKVSRTDKKSLAKEAEILKKLSHLEHFAACYDFKSQPPCTFLVMEELGPTLDEIIINFMPLCIHTVCNIAMQLIDAIEGLHMTGYMHSDIKTLNIAIGTPPTKWRKIYLFDFSIASKYPSENSRIPVSSTNLTKKPHLNGMRDDAYAVLRVLVEMRSEVPLFDRRLPDYKQNIKLREAEHIIAYHLGNEFVEFKRTIDRLELHQAPNYQYLRALTEDFSYRKSADPTRKFEWQREPGKLWEVIGVENRSIPIKPSTSKSVTFLKVLESEKTQVQSIEEKNASNSDVKASTSQAGSISQLVRKSALKVPAAPERIGPASEDSTLPDNQSAPGSSRGIFHSKGKQSSTLAIPSSEENVNKGTGKRSQIFLAPSTSQTRTKKK